MFHRLASPWPSAIVAITQIIGHADLHGGGKFHLIAPAPQTDTIPISRYKRPRQSQNQPAEKCAMIERVAIRIIASFVVMLATGLSNSSQAQSPPRMPEGMSMWNLAPAKPHLVLRSPVESKKQSAHHPTIPYSEKLIQWKVPYAYGYFGATPRHHPVRSFGHQQAYTQWRFR